jgi:glutamyl-Q tRNA(Asp) synthetase
VGRFAPSPTGILHAGSLVAALASWLDARAHGGTWLVRMEDVDAPRCSEQAGNTILQQLAAYGLVSDGPVWRQSRRGDAYQAALNILLARQLVYPCACSRSEIEAAQTLRGVTRARNIALPYPGTCREGLHGRNVRAWRFRTDATGAAVQGWQRAQAIRWQDRRLGAQVQDVQSEVGDFVLRRADGLWAYQLAVIVDDVAQGVTHIVRGEDLADNTARQIMLLNALNAPVPHYLHAPLVCAANGEKLSKQNGAMAVDTKHPLLALNGAARVLDLPQVSPSCSLGQALSFWVNAWARRWCA